MERRVEQGINTWLVSNHGIRKNSPDGVTNVIMSSVSPLKERGFIINVVGPEIPDKENNLAEITVGKRLKFSLNKTKFEASVLYRGKPKARKLLSKEKPDLVVVHQPLAGNVTHSLMTADREEKICFIGVLHAQVEALDTKTQGIYFLARHWRRPTLSSSTFPMGFTPGPLETINNRLDGRYGVSKAAIRFWNQYLPGDYELIYNGIDTNIFKPDENKKKEESNQEDTLIFFAAARLDERKGLDKLLEGVNVAVYKKGVRNFKVQIAGDGKMREPLLEKRKQLELETYVDFLGFISQEELIKRYGSAHFFILTPTGGEAFGLVLGEAMASGTPVIGSNIAGYDEVIGGNLSFAWMVNPNDPEDIASKIEAAAKIGPDKRKELGEQARKYVEERFSLTSAINNQVEYFKECIERRRSKVAEKGRKHFVAPKGDVFVK